MWQTERFGQSPSKFCLPFTFFSSLWALYQMDTWDRSKRFRKSSISAVPRSHRSGWKTQTECAAADSQTARQTEERRTKSCWIFNAKRLTPTQAGLPPSSPLLFCPICKTEDFFISSSYWIFQPATPSSVETGGGGLLRGSAPHSEFDVWRCLQQTAGRCWSTDENRSAIMMRLGRDASDGDRPETPSVKLAKLSTGNWNLPS